MPHFSSLSPLSPGLGGDVQTWRDVLIPIRGVVPPPLSPNRAGLTLVPAALFTDPILFGRLPVKNVFRKQDIYIKVGSTTRKVF